jgi:hypothetical protein
VTSTGILFEMHIQENCRGHFSLHFKLQGSYHMRIFVLEEKAAPKKNGGLAS